MANITRRWKKWSSCSCSHGHLIDEPSAKAYLEFNERYKPHKRLHLGDFLDLAALRKGGEVNGADSAESITDDFNAGISFLKEMRPTDIFIGNHEARLYELARSPRAIISHCAGGVIGQINDVARELKAKLYPYDIAKGWLKVGDTLFGHGYMFNENAIRDHAETVGKCVIGHLHIAGEQPGRRLDGAVGYCLGLLGDIERMGYARQRRATLRWRNAFAWGEYCDDETIIRIEKRCENGTWRLPI